MKRKIIKYALGGDMDSLDTGDPTTPSPNPPKSKKIPLPDYNNPESRLNYAKTFNSTYGQNGILSGYGDIPLRVNEKPQWGSDTSKNLALKEANKLGLDPALLYTSSMIEGQSGLYPQKDKKTGEMRVHTSGNKEYPVSGAFSFGLDSFSDYLPTLKKKGYLPQDFDKNFTIDVDDNASDPNNNQGVLFKTTDAGVQAKAAMMRAFYDESDDYAKKKNINLSPEQRDFFALAHFNSGSHGFEMMDAYNKAGVLKNNDFINKMPNVDVPFMYNGKQMSPEASQKLNKQIYGNVTPRLAAARGLKDQDLFNSNQQSQQTQTQSPVSAQQVPQRKAPPGVEVFESSEGRGYIDPHYGNFVKLGKGGKVPKYPDGGEIDPITGQVVLKDSKNKLGVDVWNNTSTTQTPINPNDPQDQQIFAINNQQGTPTTQNPVVPLSQFYDTVNSSNGQQVLQGTGRYVNDQGQVNTVDDQQQSNNQLSQRNLLASNQREANMDTIEMGAGLGITAINAYFDKKNNARNQRTDRRRAVMQQTNALLVNPYAEGTGSQAIMEDGGRVGGGLSRSDDYGSKSKPYPSVSSGDFAGGHRSYPIPTKADAIDALRLAHLHGREDVIAKVHSKYPGLKYGGAIMQYASGGTIHINPDNKGKFNATKKATGKSTEELTHSKNPITKKRAIFAQNAAKWHHAEYGTEIPADEDNTGIQVIDGGKANIISGNNHSNPMVEFTGKEHSEGGIGLQYGGNVAEVENKEIGWVDQEGGLNIFGKLKLPGTNQTFRKTAKDIAEEEDKVNGKKQKYLNILNNGDPVDPYQESANSTAKVMFKSLDRQSKQIAEKKEALASYQNLILAMTDQGYNQKMAYGGVMPKKPKHFADGGEVDYDNGPNDPIVKASLKKDYAKGERDLSKVKSVILHKTAGTSSAKDIVSGWDKDNRQASADFIIDKDGTITQVGDLGDTKWHSGIKGINQNSLGVEIVGSSADESDMTAAQYQALKRLHKDVFEPMGIQPNDYFGHTQVNHDKGFDFPKSSSIKNVLAKSGISNTYEPDYDRVSNMISYVSNNAGNVNQPQANKPAAQTTSNMTTNDFVPEYTPLSNDPGIVNTPYGPAKRSPTLFSDKVNLGNGDRKRGYISPLAIEQIAPELLTLATNNQEPVNQQTYQPDLKQTFDISYQLGRNENQSSFNQVAKIAEQTGNVDALSQLAAQKYKADESYNNQEVQGNAMQKLQVYGQNTDTLNDAKVKNLALIADQQNRQAQAKFNTRKEDLGAFASISGKVLQNNLENRTYNAYANLFKHYGFDKKGNVTFNPDEVTQKFTSGEAQQFGLLSAQQGAGAIMNGDFSRKFTKKKNEDGSTTTTETYGNNKKIQDEYKTLKSQGFDDNIIGNMLRAKYPETINPD